MKLPFSALVTGLLLACLSTEPCACPPATSLFILFGQVVDTDGQAAARAPIAVKGSRSQQCSFDDGETMEDFPPTAGDDGKFRLQLRSYFGTTAVRCLRVTARRDTSALSDSAVIEGLVVRFRNDREMPESVGVLLRLP